MGTTLPSPKDLPTNMLSLENDASYEAIEAMEAAVDLTRRAKAYDGAERKTWMAADRGVESIVPGWDYSMLPAELQQQY